MSLWKSEQFRESQFVKWSHNLVSQLGYEPNLKTAREYWDEAMVPGNAYMAPRTHDIIKIERSSPKDFDAELSQFTERLMKELPWGGPPEKKTAREYFLEGSSVGWAAYCENSFPMARLHDGDSPEDIRHYWNTMR